MATTKVIAVADIKRHERVIVMNGLARPAYEGEPKTIMSIEEINKGDIIIYDPIDRIVYRKR